MTVAEFIRILETHPPDLRVMVQGYEEGYDDLTPGCVVAGEARLNVHTAWYYGRHEEVLAGEKQKGRETAPALFIHRPWHDDGE